MDLRTKFVKNYMIPLNNTFMIDEECVVDLNLVENLKKVNISKIPIYKNTPENIIGYLKVKNLISLTLEDNIKLKDSNVISSIVQIA